MPVLLSFDYITYSDNNIGKHCVLLICVHKGKCTTFIFILMWFGLSHLCGIQYNTGWLFVIVLHFVKRFVWDRSVLTQYIYYRDFYCLWAVSRIRDCAIVGYSPPPDQQSIVILWHITITVWLKSKVNRVTFLIYKCMTFLHHKI